MEAFRVGLMSPCPASEVDFLTCIALHAPQCTADTTNRYDQQHICTWVVKLAPVRDQKLTNVTHAVTVDDASPFRAASCRVKPRTTPEKRGGPDPVLALKVISGIAEGPANAVEDK